MNVTQIFIFPGSCIALPVLMDGLSSAAWTY